MLIGCGETERRVTRVKDRRVSPERREGSFTDSRNLIGSLQCDGQMDSSSAFYVRSLRAIASLAGFPLNSVGTQQNQEPPWSDAEFCPRWLLCDGATVQRDLDWRQTAKAKVPLRSQGNAALADK